MSVNYYSLYKEKNNDSIIYFIPIRENKDEWAVEGFVYLINSVYQKNDNVWAFRKHLENPDDWNEQEWSNEEYMKIIPISEAPNKHQLIERIFE